MRSPPLLAVGVLSAAVLGYELLLVRLTALIHWHHLAALAIGVALLGFGSAGVLLTLIRERSLALYPASFSFAAVLFALAAPLSYIAVQHIPFNALELAWSVTQWARLILIDLFLFMPFFFAASALCLAYAAHPNGISRLYGADIAGAGLGCLLILLLLHRFPSEQCLRAVVFLGLVAAFAASRFRWWALLLTAGLTIAIPSSWLVPSFSPYKDLPQALAVKDARIVAERHGPLGRITAVVSPAAPSRHAPGLSLLTPAVPPEQIEIFVDGQAAGAVLNFTGDFAALAHFAAMASALPHRLLSAPSVLILGAGSGTDVLRAKYLGASHVVAVEADPQIVALVEEDLAEFAGHPYRLPDVRLAIAEARGFLARSHERFDLIEIALLEGQTSSVAGLTAGREDYLHTVEAFQSYLDHLREGGMLAITRWLRLPPRDVLRLVATAIVALERHGIAMPNRSLMLVRSLNTVTLLVKNGAFTAAEIATAKNFAETFAFDLAYFPGATAAETNRFNVVAEDEFFAGVMALLGPQRERFLREAPFALTPATDDRPYFGHFFSWKSLAEFWRLRREGALPPIDWSYPVLLLALLLAVTLGMVLILLPLAGSKSRRAFALVPAHWRRGVPIYFLLLGIAFMAVEMPLIAQLTLLLAHPTYAAAIVLVSLLVFAGLGAWYSDQLKPTSYWPFVALLLLLILYAFGLQRWVRIALAWEFPWRLALALLLVAPLAFCLGMPFPLGLRAVARHAALLTPWAWGINGFASVAASHAATLAMLHVGHTLVLSAAAFAYLLAMMTWRGLLYAEERIKSPRGP